ncbi:DegV domain-containing protein [Sinosporangium siamense]|uniref:DegV domain-containing protein n=1 Tax=Sinosporangium siamense TaxID=1367973 RepID=A0A919V2H9_9ACTN|nr:DegV domain-containing protein [Sinosporangium siamense]
MVPLQVIVNGQAFDDTDACPETTSTSAPVPGSGDSPTTSRPSPATFGAAYETAKAAGAEAVVSIHLSEHLSGTLESARNAAAGASLPVEVVDSGSVGMGLGFAVLAAASTAARGGTAGDVAETARRCAAACRSFFYVDTLEYLRRGGRIGAAASLLGTALLIKPLLHIADGVIAPLEKVRTASRAIARLQDLAVEAAAQVRPSGEGRVAIAVQHLGAQTRADTLAADLTRRVPGPVDITVTEVGAVIGAHAGPGMLGVTVAPVMW